MTRSAAFGALSVPNDDQRAAVQRALARWREHRRPPAHLAPGIPGTPGIPGRGAAPHTVGLPGTTGVTPTPGARGGPSAPGTATPRSTTTNAADELGRSAGEDIRIVDVELLSPGRPGVLDVVAEMDGRLAHAVFGLRRPGDELRLVRTVEEPALGMVEDDYGMAVLVDALQDADAARVLLEAVGGDQFRRSPGTRGGRARPDVAGQGGPHPDQAVVAALQDDDEAVALGFGRRCTLSVFPWLRHGPHPGVAFLAALDEVGFNHLAAPIAIWRRAGRDLGVAQEILAGAARGWALALTSLRDLFDAGGSPDAAGGDFGPEARALGTMAARMHLAVDQAFGRRSGDVVAWVDAIEAELGEPAVAHLSAPDRMGDTFAALRASGLHPPALRTHGDFHLGRTARTDHGWVLADCMPGGTSPDSDDPVFRSPLADVADMLWSLHHAAAVAASDRGPGSDPSRLTDLAEAWEMRNRRAFMAGYLSTPGIGGLVPSDRDTVRRLVAAFEIARAARRPRAVAPPA